MLVTEICDKITSCVELLQADNLLDKSMSLREIYDKYLHPEILNLNDTKMWDALAEGTVLDVFQFSTGVGLATAKQVKPRNPMELTSANALMRLMGEKGKERPLDRYCRIKNNIDLWYNEVRTAGLTEQEIKILEPYYLPNYGVPASQEDLMEVCMDKNIAHFTLKEANGARKTVAKKHMDEIPILKEKFLTQCPRPEFGEYVWQTTMGPQMGYSFAKPHALAYSFVGIQTLFLATNFPAIYWNCACLIVNAGGADLLEADDIDEDNEEETTKKKNKSVNYGKISAAIGESISKGIKILPPDINKSNLIFKPDLERNAIIYGMKGITRIGTQLVYDIFHNRPYNSIEDFLEKVKVNKTQMISLIKSGAFDNLYQDNRIEVMKKYIDMIADRKKRITLQNMQMLITKNLIPEELDFQRRIFNFTKYVKKNKINNIYVLDDYATAFIENNFDIDMLENVIVTGNGRTSELNINTWENIYQKEMNKVRNWMKANQQEILDKLNSVLLEETIQKYCEGSVSKWEMESLSFYYHEHELAKLQNGVYGIVDYNTLNEEPEIDRVFSTKNGDEITLFKINRIAGTVIDKDKNKSQIVLLTPTGVVTVKVWKNQYAAWDKQISERGADGKKHIVEKSFFTKGNKLIITGIRRGDNFIPKKYKNTEYPIFEQIISIDDKGFILESKTERAEVDE